MIDTKGFILLFSFIFSLNVDCLHKVGQVAQNHHSHLETEKEINSVINQISAEKNFLCHHSCLSCFGPERNECESCDSSKHLSMANVSSNQKKYIKQQQHRLLRETSV